MAQWVKNLMVSVRSEDAGLTPGLAQWVKDMVLSQASVQVLAVAQTGSCSSDLTPSSGTYICHRCSLRKKTNKQNQTETQFVFQKVQAWDAALSAFPGEADAVKAYWFPRLTLNSKMVKAQNKKFVGSIEFTPFTSFQGL